MHSERSIALGCLCAWVLWILTFMLLLSGTLTVLLEDSIGVPLVLLSHALALSAAAATATIRTFFAQQRREMQNVFQMGRDYSGGEVARLPSRDRL